MDGAALLCCAEGTAQRRRTRPDRAFASDPRVLENLLRSEENVLPNPNYLEIVQRGEMNEDTRRLLVDWMMQICDECKSEDILLPLSVNLLDRVLSQQYIERKYLQLTAAACLFLASKLAQTCPLSIERLCYQSDGAFTPQQLTKMELIVLERLKWDVGIITPLDFLDLIFHRLPVTADQLLVIRKHATTLVTLTCFEYRFIMHPPSTIAAAAVCAAVDGMKMSMMDRLDPVDVIHELTHIDKDFIVACRNQIEEALRRQLSSIGSSSGGSGSGSGTSRISRGDENKENNLPDTDTPTYALQTF
ncbi:G1/S-specific cyclin-D3-like isoform X2 [Oscarella lobularis]|uniref:G1/S-specific cyclin-D3-like isoform X2 n=1 Tax=Oscarella lobularis TaxID=121494 RepID=UPI0033136DC9